MHIVCGNKQPAYQCHAENDDNFWQRLSEAEGTTGSIHTTLWAIFSTGRQEQVRLEVWELPS